MLQTPPTPLWLELVKAFGGPLIAAVVVILGLIWRDRIERRNVAQAWFDQTYITEGIDLLIAHLTALQNELFRMRGHVSFRFEVVPIPSRVLWQMLMITPGAHFFGAIGVLEQIVTGLQREDTKLDYEKEALDELGAFASNLLGHAEEIRNILLGSKVTAKADIGRFLRHPDLKRLNDDAKLEFLDSHLVRKVSDRFVDLFPAPEKERIKSTLAYPRTYYT